MTGNNAAAKVSSSCQSEICLYFQTRKKVLVELEVVAHSEALKDLIFVKHKSQTVN